MSGSISKSWLTYKPTFVDGIDLHVHEDVYCSGTEDASPWILNVCVSPANSHPEPFRRCER